MPTAAESCRRFSLRWFWHRLKLCLQERRLPYGISKIAHALKHFLIRIFPPLGYQLPYWISYRRYRASGKSPITPDLDLVFVLKKEGPSWILEAICREIARHFDGRYIFHYAEKSPALPPAKAYFFAHYSYFPKCFKKTPSIWGSTCLVWYPHEKESPDIWRRRELLYAFNRSVTTVVCPCSKNGNELIRQGVDPDRVTFVLGAADPEVLLPHQRTGQGAVGFCTAYYPRKCPDKMLEIIRLLPHRRFILLGPEAHSAGHRHWSRYSRFKELLSLPNLTYAEVPYSKYPLHYAQMDVFVSVSMLEGGPIPLLEAMMSNAVPVASKTGFAPDLIQHGENGFLFDTDASVSRVSSLIEDAFTLRADVRRTVEHLSWRNFSLAVQKIIPFDRKDRNGVLHGV